MNEIDTSRVITWQYDKAETFLSLLEAREDAANMVVSDLWNRFYDSVFDIRTCGRFGLWVWGILLGISRPLVAIESGGTTITQPLSDDAFRRVLIARFYWMNANPSMPTAAKYFSLLLNCGAGSDYPYRKVKIADKYNMTISIELNWLPEAEIQAILSSPDIVNHPTGVEVLVEFPESPIYIGFNGYWSSGNEETRIGLEATEKKFWGYPVSTGMVIPPDPYYKADGTELLYDSDENEYYAVEEGQRVVYGNDAQHPMYDASDAQTRHLLSGINDGALYYEQGDNKIVPSQPYDEYGHALTRDSGGWYYIDGTKKYYYGQCLANFNNGSFYDNTIVRISVIDEIRFYLNKYISEHQLPIAQIAENATVNDVLAKINEVADYMGDDPLANDSTPEQMAQYVTSLYGE